MNILQLFWLAFFLALLGGCGYDSCKDIDCGPGDCDEGVCICPEGRAGVNCEIDLCFGAQCINGDCDPQTRSCNCNPNYYGEECNIFCVNGAFTEGACNCSEGFEGATCETESRDRFLGWWSCEKWNWSSRIGGSQVAGFLPATLKFECGNSIPEIELFPTENSSGLMLLKSEHKLVGHVSKNTINFDLQYLTTEVTVNGSASLGDDRILNIELFIFNPTTTFTEVAKGTFTLYRNLKDCN